MRRFYYILAFLLFAIFFDSSAQHTFLLQTGEARPVLSFSFSGDTVLYTFRGAQQQIHRTDLIQIMTADRDLIDPNNHRITLYTGEVVFAKDFKIEDRIVTYMPVSSDSVSYAIIKTPACMIEYIMSMNGEKFVFRRCSDIVYLTDGKELYARELVSKDNFLSFYEHGINAPFHNYPHHLISKVLRYDEEREQENWVDFTKVFKLEKRFRRKRGAKNIFMIGSFLAAGAGAYTFYSSEDFYKGYGLALDSNIATELRNKTELYDNLTIAAIGVTAAMAIITIVKAAQQNSSEKRMINQRTELNFSVTPDGKSQTVGLLIHF